MQFLAPHTNIFLSLVFSLIKLASNHEWEAESSRNLGPVGDLIAVTDRRGLLPLDSIRVHRPNAELILLLVCGGSFHDGCCCMVGLVVVKLCPLPTL